MKKIKCLLAIILMISLFPFFLKNHLGKFYNKNKQIINNKHIIKLYWSGHNSPNAGDYFGKWILEKMGFVVSFSKKPEIIICGSILGFIKSFNSTTKIWGAGFHFDEEVSYINNSNNIYAVRGKLSLGKLNLTTKLVLGDPGLLLSIFYKPLTKKKYDICIISHYIDYKIFSKKYGDKYYVINMGNNNIENIADSINQCHFAFSSSLHGIIFSHSLGIPAIHLENKMLVSKRNFKFKDYFSVLDIPYIKEDLKKSNFKYYSKKI